MPDKKNNDTLIPQVKKKDSGAFWVGLGFILSFISALFLIMKGPVKAPSTKSGFGRYGGYKGARAGIAVINISGVIKFGSSGGFLQQTDGAEAISERIRKLSLNDHVKGLVLRINSPGGTIGATQEIYNSVLRFKKTGKKVVVSMGDVAASGGYYIACAADRIFANPGTITGSIGVIISAPNMKGLYDWIKIKWNVIKSGRYKDILSPFRNLRNDEKRLLFKIVQDSYRQFYNEVLKSRKIKPVLLNRYAQGQIFSGNQARTIKLVDELGGFEDAVMAIGKMIGVSGRPYIIRRRRSVSFTDIFRLLENFQKGFQGFKLIKHSPSTGYVNISYLYRSF